MFCNPPYGKEIGKWVEKCSIESQKPNTICVMLVPARTDTKWFHEFIYNKAEMWFLKGRLKFGNSTNSAPFPSMIVIFAKCKNLRIMEIRQIKPCKCYWYKITGDKEKDAALLDKLKDLMPDTTYLYQPNMDIEGRKGRIVYNNVNHIEVINDVDMTFSQIVKMIGVELKVKE